MVNAAVNRSIILECPLQIKPTEKTEGMGASCRDSAFIAPLPFFLKHTMTYVRLIQRESTCFPLNRPLRGNPARLKELTPLRNVKKINKSSFTFYKASEL